MAIIISPLRSSCRCIAICGEDTVLRTDGLPLSFDDLALLQSRSSIALLFEERNTDLCALAIQGSITMPDGYHSISLRNFFARYGEDEAFPYFRAKALGGWLSDNRFCPRCGTMLEVGTQEEETSLLCPECRNVLYPRINPCIIVLVHRGDEILLALHRHRNASYYSCIAGFMEAGESAEQAVRREIMEETGIAVRNVRYYGSQSWPFPSQLMLGFTAEYDSGEIRIQESELQHAAWFPRHACPATPPRGSLAYRLIHQV